MRVAESACTIGTLPLRLCATRCGAAAAAAHPWLLVMCVAAERCVCVLNVCAHPHVCCRSASSFVCVKDATCGQQCVCADLCQAVAGPGLHAHAVVVEHCKRVLLSHLLRLALGLQGCGGGSSCTAAAAAAIAVLLDRGKVLDSLGVSVGLTSEVA
ncbi:hypothetical protein COO60DRAFT_62060 [Scenedesmus sp. NREL 46B-D3]|nr:hypothetical protein COO60DRAFT_62060 [Scenedesmus sp. NREL 46B-D3]